MLGSQMFDDRVNSLGIQQINDAVTKPEFAQRQEKFCCPQDNVLCQPFADRRVTTLGPDERAKVGAGGGPRRVALEDRGAKRRRPSDRVPPLALRPTEERASERVALEDRCGGGSLPKAEARSADRRVPTPSFGIKTERREGEQRVALEDRGGGGSLPKAEARSADGRVTESLLWH
jgi:hypothetical protein